MRHAFKSLFVAFFLFPAVAFAAPPSPPPVAASWTGFYAGVVGGWGTARAAQTNTRSGVSNGFYDQDGAMVGLTAGYNWQFGQWVWGLETDISWSDISGAETDCGPKRSQTCPTEIRTFGTTRGRAGVVFFNNTLVYATGGVAYADIRAHKLGAASANGEDWRGTWTAGGGFETRFADRWSFKFEYLYATFSGTVATYTLVNASPVTAVAAEERDIHLFRGGLNWHF